jgi:hypothetical protein
MGFLRGGVGYGREERTYVAILSGEGWTGRGPVLLLRFGGDGGED